MNVALTLRIHESVASIAPDAWEQLRDERWTPFQDRTWMLALEETGCASPERGWLPQHLALWRGDTLVALALAYVRDDSQGEFVFDHAWASAAQRAGIRYYPKLTLSVPFTPCPGRRVFVRPGEDRVACTRLLFNAAMELAREAGLSSVHALFVADDEAEAAAEAGMFLRHGIQYHWQNAGYRSYDDFLARFAHARRKTLRREQRAAEAQGIILRTRRGDALSPDDATLVHELYTSTVDKFVWGRRYLSEVFFARLLREWRHRLELVEALRNGKVVAGAFNVASKTHLYGRYWGCFEEHPFLHFNVCYYHSIAACIARGVKVFEGGAGGEHKLTRGFEPVLTHSAHWIAHQGLDRAVRDFVARERSAIAAQLPAIRDASGLKPFTSPECD